MLEETGAILAAHRRFWARQGDTPLFLLSVAQQFPLLQFAPMRRLLAGTAELLATVVDPAEYAADYENQWREAAAAPGKSFWTARPIPGVPWLEGALGCSIHATGSDLWAEWPERGLPPQFRPGPQSAVWQAKYLEFLRFLRDKADGRFPVGQSILRGPSDAGGAILGGTDLVMSCYDRPGLVHSLLTDAAETLIALVGDQWSIVPPFHGGYVMGGFGIWCPEQCLVFQEDLTAVLSPAIYRDFLLEIDRGLAQAFPYSGIHLHQSSLYLVEDLLTLEPLNLIQITCDDASADLTPLIETAREVLRGKHLLLSGFFSRAQAEWLAETLPAQGLALQVLARSMEETAGYSGLFAK